MIHLRARRAPPPYWRAGGGGGAPLALLGALAWLPLGCGGEAGVAGGTAERPVSPRHADEGAAEVFVDATAQTGLDFTHVSGRTGEFYFIEHMGPGVALFDYDNDGDLDLYLVQGGPVDRAGSPRSDLPRDRLLRNDLPPAGDAPARVRFTDVTDSSGIDARGYGMGVAAGDFDNDGWLDLYVTNWGPNQLWRNEGDGSFQDVTKQAGVDDPRWSTSAAFADYDADGWLDLYVASYVDYSLKKDRPCYRRSSERDYCGPTAYEPLADRLFHNRGVGRFRDVSSRAGILAEVGAGLGVVSGDFDADGRLDFYVANDALPNVLWIQVDGGRFRNDALLAGSALNRDGKAEASMGVDVADFDADGDEDLFITHLNQETNTLYVNTGTGLFEDRSLESGLGVPSWNYTGFGTGWIDYNNDGLLDLWVANGSARTLPELVERGDPLPLHQTNQLFRNLGAGRFEEASAAAGVTFHVSEVSRGLALGDVDNDGDTDVVVANNSGPARLLLNGVGNRAPWLGLRLVDRRGRDALGARVTVRRGGLPLLVRRARTGGSYCSSSDPRVLVGLGASPQVETVEVSWPGGGVEEWRDLPVGRYSTLREGSGRLVAVRRAE